MEESYCASLPCTLKITCAIDCLHLHLSSQLCGTSHSTQWRRISTNKRGHVRSRLARLGPNAWMHCMNEYFMLLLSYLASLVQDMVRQWIFVCVCRVTGSTVLFSVCQDVFHLNLIKSTNNKRHAASDSQPHSRACCSFAAHVPIEEIQIISLHSSFHFNIRLLVNGSFTTNWLYISVHKVQSKAVTNLTSLR